MKTNNNLLELSPKYISQNSFYKKAMCYYNEGKWCLYSYNTLVCTIDCIKHTYELNYNIASDLLFSNTTLKHIKEFLQQLFYNDNIKLTKNDIINNANN